VEERMISSSAIELPKVGDRGGMPSGGTLIYVDRVFSVKGVGTVALGFVLSGEVHLHDRLRPVPGVEGASLEVRGVQINDQDFDGAGRGIRVGLSLRGAEAEELKRTCWLDDGSFELSDDLSLEFAKSNFYRPGVEGRDLHLQLAGETVSSRLETGTGGLLRAKLPTPVPVWDGMRSVVLDLNGRSLRVAGGATLKR
jgi:selenocysteine-specific translation elongation factor